MRDDLNQFFFLNFVLHSEVKMKPQLIRTIHRDQCATVARLPSRLEISGVPIAPGPFKSTSLSAKSPINFWAAVSSLLKLVTPPRFIHRKRSRRRLARGAHASP
jgi:hypothetical protein